MGIGETLLTASSIQFISILKGHYEATSFTKSFLRMIEKDMLIVQPNRKSCKKIAQALKAMRIPVKQTLDGSSSLRTTSLNLIPEEPEVNETGR